MASERSDDADTPAIPAESAEADDDAAEPESPSEGAASDGPPASPATADDAHTSAEDGPTEADEAGAAADHSATSDAPEATEAPEATDAPDEPTGPAREIEDESLGDLLGLDLRDTMGQAEAASNIAEDVLSAPATVTVISREEIARSGARTIPDLLRFVPGVQVQRIAPGSALVALRGASGLTGNNVVVMVDGTPINDPGDGHVEWAAIPVDVLDIERIEVVRGPVSTVHGANAFTGVVHIVTLAAVGDIPNVGARVIGGVSTEGRPSASASAHYVRARERLEQAYFLRGRTDATGSDIDGQLRGVGRHPAAHTIGATARIAAHFGEAHHLELLAAASFLERSTLEHLAIDADPEQRLQSFGRLAYRYAPTDGVVEGVSLWVRSNWMRVLGHGGDEDETHFNYGGTNSRAIHGGADIRLRAHDRFALTVGAETRGERVDAPYLHPDAVGTTRFGYALFARAAWDPIDTLTLTADIRGDVPAVTGELSPSARLSVAYHTEEFAARLTFATAFRAPTYVERGGAFVDPAAGHILLEGSSAVKNPAADSIEASVVGRVGDLSLSGATYLQRFRSLVNQQFDAIPRRTFVSDDRDQLLLGVELHARYDHSDALALQATLGGLYFPSDDDVPVGTPLLGEEGHNSRLTASAQASGAAWNDRLRYGGGLQIASKRDFRLSTGIPPVIVNQSLGPHVFVHLMGEIQPSLELPLWLSLRVNGLVRDGPEVALPGAGQPGSTILVGLAYRSL